MSRPPKLTPETHDKIVALMRAGNYFETACLAAGISDTTGYKWKAWGEGRDVGGQPTPKDLTRYRAFRDAVTRAEAEAEAEVVVHVRRHIPEDPRVAMEYLRRRAPHRWGREVREQTTEVTVSAAQPILDALEEYGPVLEQLAREADDYAGEG
jgi:hypothetical protein